MTPSRETNEHYRRLAFELGDGDRGRMLSGWQCENPFVDQLLEEVRARSARVDFREYTYFDADEVLADRIVKLHQQLDGVTPPAALAGAGASPLITTFVSWLADSGTTQVHYVPPLYHTLSTGLTRFGIELVPAALVQPYEPAFELSLPDYRSVLLLTDPIWYAGVAVAASVLAEIREWQLRTESLVFVDGSLQYLGWDGARAEASATLVPDQTYRLISPCKQLAVNGYRFAYLLLPANAEGALAWIYANQCGPASAESVVFAHAALDAVHEGSIPRALTNRASKRLEALISNGFAESGPTAESGYYAFLRLAPHPSSTALAMDGRFFDQPRYPGFSKVNLLSPSFDRAFPEVSRLHNSAV